MLLATLIHRASLPCPQVGPDPAARLLEQHYDLGGTLKSLGSQQDLNYRIDSDRGRFVLKICRGDYAAVELQAQHAALKHLQEHSDVRVPKVITALDGEDLLTETVAGHTVHLRLLDYIDGQPLTHVPHLGREVIAGFGELCGRMSLALAGFEHPGLERTLQWDPRHALELITHLLSTLENLPQRAALEQVAEQVERRVRPLADHLPWQAVHMDITDDNVVWQRDAQRHWQVQGVIDFGDLVRTWRIADLSVTCAALLHHAEGDPFAILPAIQACHAITALQHEELQVLWPLIVARAAVLVLSSEQQQRLDPDNTYLLKNAEHEWEIFNVATSVPFELMEAAILGCVGAQLPPIAGEGFAPLLPGLVGREFALIDLGVLSPHFEAGNWEQEGIDRRLLEQAAVVHGLAASRYAQYRLSRTQPDSAVEPETFPLHVELHMPLGATVEAPFAGTLRYAADGLMCLHSEQLSVRLWGVNALLQHGAAVVKGQVLGEVAGPLTVQLCRAELEPPLFCTPSRAVAWQALCPSPATLLGLACDAEPELDPEALLARRDASFARSQKHYYIDPPRIERGWRNHLIDMQGRSYLDMLNNVAVLGHGHPRMAQVAARQWSLLNTNSRFHYAAIAEFSERLLALAPDSMDRVFLVNSGTEANDLAIRLAWAHSGGRDMLSVLEAYHGWSVAADAVSTSIADNPQALSSRPDWVHPVTAPNTYRGEFRGQDSAPDYVRSVEHNLAKIAAQNRQLAGFICEPVYGNAGGISLPPGYLQQVYALVRAQGGVCIADEVQVGYGRMGHFFWGFEEQGVVPDIITMAKGMGNGQPLGAVITRREIAEALEAEGYFFSSSGGSPVSCRIGMAVLDVMEEEKLWENAQVVGGHFKARLEALVEQHPLVGAVHGSGFYLGLELVRDRQTLEPATEETALLCDRLRELGIFMQPTGDYLNILKIKPPMVTSRQSVDFFVDMLAKVLDESL
ncbi:4-aminobutyrate aminotransferase-like enzyme/Ser/Thr protein kinase RdoA (MazF antagonist) [Pseudomonas sp. BIGb0450]|uniref:aminotransferase n=1 Tax=unclassified Pseudomonas TaxID=196821 RepID=UPI002168E25D|nr:MULTISPECIES: aminotransferase [unclassified Pseudomonas]MCS3415842.1 4-aminobutyrate aminotransferase-like enzyme/Ser/Thr protein kinase RdoA (MazF antagonist) [Pseudomonas sp. BIGb0558]MCS3434751.1 4-aminobutyrate aminotransferase-like enzyme/Ser/Thr protein kinase RdoA (MazF antagonist) [Pseudomonas sp. BIGb0450]